MTNKPKAKGTATETAVCRYLLGHGVMARRVALHGTNDVGDIHVWGGRIVLEVKARNHWASPKEIADWMAELDRESANVPGCDAAALVVKRPGSGAANAGDWFVYLRALEFQWLNTAGAPGAVALVEEPVSIDLATLTRLLLALPARTEA